MHPSTFCPLERGIGRRLVGPRLVLATVSLLGLAGCGHNGPTEPIGVETHEIQVSSSLGEVHFTASGATWVLRDMITRTPVPGVTVVEIPDGSNRGYLIVDPSGRYRPQAFHGNQVSGHGAGLAFLAAPMGAVALRDILLVPRTALGNVTHWLGSLSDRAWDYVLTHFYDHSRMPLSDLEYFVLQSAGVAHAYSAGKEIGLHMLAVGAGVAVTPVVAIVSIGLTTIGDVLRFYLLTHYLQAGYQPADLFDVSIPKPTADFLGMQLAFRPVGPPGALGAAPGGIRIEVANAVDGTGVPGAMAAIIGVTSRSGSIPGGVIQFNGLVAGPYIVELTAPGYLPVTANALIEPNVVTHLQLRMSPGGLQIVVEAAGGTLNFPGTAFFGTAILVVMRHGPDEGGTLVVRGPTGWNGGNVYEGTLESIRTGRFHIGWLWLIPPVSGRYIVEVNAAGGGQGRTEFIVDQGRRVSPTASVTVQAVSLNRVVAQWQPVTGAAGYYLSLADGDNCDVNGLCPTIQSLHVGATTHTATFDPSALRPNQRFFVGVYAIRTPLFVEPPPVPAFFDIGYRASTIHTAPGSAPGQAPDAQKLNRAETGVKPCVGLRQGVMSAHHPMQGVAPAASPVCFGPAKDGLSR